MSYNDEQRAKQQVEKGNATSRPDGPFGGKSHDVPGQGTYKESPTGGFTKVDNNKKK